MRQGQGHRWFAFFYEKMAKSMEKSFLHQAREEVAGGARGRVLEIGCGPGFSFRYYGKETAELVATDPDEHMLKRARKRAGEFPGKLVIERADAQALPYADGSFDTVVSMLVLCSVGDLSKTLSEVRRVLKADGQFRFYEHVRYGRRLAALCQDMVTPFWSWFGAGCHPNRDIARAIEGAG
ncbi:MAG TPA: class I SAM-dependent methyltransferase, partial [Dehalococcoidia bacterium]|nr:class I SAM-dependent methyltransferase [Dehalococcoidia bacterium]